MFNAIDSLDESCAPNPRIAASIISKPCWGVSKAQLKHPISVTLRFIAYNLKFLRIF